MNFYKHHLGDYDGHTAHLSWDEDMAYTRLIRAYYRREGPIPDGERHRLTRAISKAQKAAVDTVLNEFFVKDGDVWRQKRCDEEIAAYQAQASTNRRIARQRTVERTVNEPSHDSSTKHTPNQNQIPEPEARNQEPSKNKPKAQAPFVLPDWIPKAQWDAWVEGRKKVRKAPTEWAMKLAVAKLEELRAQGHPPGAVLAESAFNNWSGLFPPKEKK